MPSDLYVIDTSALVDLRPYPIDVFKTLWTNIEQLVRTNLLISSEQVLEELKKQDDEILRWAKKHRKIFKPLSAAQIQEVKKIEAAYPELVDANKETPDADPFVIALALEKDPQQTLISFNNKRIVVAQERLKSNKINIPFVCQDYGIECIAIVDLFRRESWKF